MSSILLRDVTAPDGRRADIELPVAQGGDPSPGGLRIVRCGGRLVTPGLADIHLHPDKAYLLNDGEAGGAASTLAEAIAGVRARKPRETVQSVLSRTRRLLDTCLAHGTTAVRLHAEIDPLLGLRSVEAVLEAQRAYAGRMTVEVVAFAQEGIQREPGTESLLRQALILGAGVVGGITYQDGDVGAHLDVVCGLAREFACPLDLHADFGLPPGETVLPLVARKVREYGLGGRVLVGHCTSLAKMPAEQRDVIARQLADSGVALVVLPRTDLYLDGLVAPLDALAAVGLQGFIATNNVQNPFTPVGEPSLPEVAQVYVLAARAGTLAQLDKLARSFWRARTVLGMPAGASDESLSGDLCLWDCQEPWQIVTRGLRPLAVFVAGIRVAGTVPEAVAAAPGRINGRTADVSGRLQAD